MAPLMPFVEAMDVQTDGTDLAAAFVAAGVIVSVSAHRALYLVAAVGRTRRVLLGMRVVSHNLVRLGISSAFHYNMRRARPAPFVRFATGPLSNKKIAGCGDFVRIFQGGEGGPRAGKRRVIRTHKICSSATMDKFVTSCSIDVVLCIANQVKRNCHLY